MQFKYSKKACAHVFLLQKIQNINLVSLNLHENYETTLIRNKKDSKHNKIAWNKSHEQKKWLIFLISVFSSTILTHF